MPIQKCRLKNGKSGWKWGKSGKCYKNKADAEKQMKAIYANGYRENPNEKVFKTSKD